MEELIARVTQKTGLDAATAEKAIGIILAFLQKEGPPAEVNQLFAALPGAEDAIAQAGTGGGGGGLMGMMGSMGGGVMALGGQLMGAGVSMGQMQPLGTGTLRLRPREGRRGRDGPDRRLDPGPVAVRLKILCDVAGISLVPRVVVENKPSWRRDQSPSP